jgi:ribosome biogenesis GTPase
LIRKVAGEFAGEQILGANIDIGFYLNSLNMDLNLRRMERYLIMFRDGNVKPIVVLTKADLIAPSDLENVLLKIKDVTKEIPVYVISCKHPETMNVLLEHFEKGVTVALLGSSGVGKSTLTNFLLGGDRQKIQEIRSDDDKGKHTTTSRSIFPTPKGAFIMDTPGIRELQLWEGESGLDETFKDILELEKNCRYHNCSHKSEPGCAILEAIGCQFLDPNRLKSFQKLGREQRFIENKHNAANIFQQKKVWKKRSVEARRRDKSNWKSSGFK